MSDLAQKTSLTAYQRWELPTFDMAQAEGGDALPGTPGQADAPPAVTLPTAAEVENIHQQAHEEGYQAGYAEGAAKAREEEQAACDDAKKARDEEKIAREEADRLAGIIGALDKELHQVDQQVAQDLLNLSLEIAKQMLRQEIKVKPELLLGIVNEAIGELPHFSQHVNLILHPSDAELVRVKMGEQLDHAGWKIREDTQIECGGCRVETAHSQIDATMATRWKRVVSTIGQDNSWLES